MKLSIATAFLLTQSASAFAPQSTQRGQNIALNMADAPAEMEESMAAPAPSMEEPVAVVEEPAAKPATPKLPSMSQSMPFMARPAALDGSMAGDVGFDPLGFAKNQEDLNNFREAEIKHARLAMLAAAGWPLSELFDKKLATWTGMTPLVDSSDRAPSLLNGGLGKVSPIYWGACLALAAAIDVYGIQKSREGNDDYFPGNLGFDPLGLYPKDKAGQLEMQLKEIKNGRLAMIAITAFAAQEFVQKIGVVDETPIFFKPFSTVIHEYANSGYIIPDNL